MWIQELKKINKILEILTRFETFKTMHLQNHCAGNTFVLK